MRIEVEVFHSSVVQGLPRDAPTQEPISNMTKKHYRVQYCKINTKREQHLVQYLVRRY
jgi:hypothetical protein